MIHNYAKKWAIKDIKNFIQNSPYKNLKIE